MDQEPTRLHTATNRQKLELLQTSLQQGLAEVLQPGFYGRLSVVLPVQDGTIQGVEMILETRQR